MLISSDSNWPLKGSQWDEIVCVKNSYFYAPTIFIRYLWKVSSLMELTKIEDFAKLPSAKCQIAKCQNAKCQMFFGITIFLFLFRDISTHCEDCWSGKSWWHLKTEKDRRLFYCVVLWYQGEALLKIRASGTGGGGGYLCPHAPPTHKTQ